MRKIHVLGTFLKQVCKSNKGIMKSLVPLEFQTLKQFRVLKNTENWVEKSSKKWQKLDLIKYLVVLQGISWNGQKKQNQKFQVVAQATTISC